MTNDKQIQNTIKRPKDRSIRTRQKTEKGERGGGGGELRSQCVNLYDIRYSMNS